MMVDRHRIEQLLGPDIAQTGVAAVSSSTHKSGALHSMSFRMTTGEDVPALYLPPAYARAPAILYCHAHGNRYDIGARELTDGRPALQGAYLPTLSAAGYAVLCVEMPCFGARAGQTESATAKARLWEGRTLFGQMLAEQGAALDWLRGQPDVDSGRIGVMGISMGGTLAWWLAALRPDVAAAVSMCCFADLGTLIRHDAHDGHGIYMTVPGLAALTRTGCLAALAAPVPAMHCVGLADWSTPPEAFEVARRDIEAGYAAAGASDALAFHVAEDHGHAETPKMRHAVLQFLSRHLRPGPA